MAFKFESLIVWQKALDLTEKIDELTKRFPTPELYVLSSQIKRAADSVVLNIAEGSTGQSNKEFSRFLGIALRSAIEVVTCLFIGRKRKIVSEEDFSARYNDLTEIIKMIQALRKSLD